MRLGEDGSRERTGNRCEYCKAGYELMKNGEFAPEDTPIINALYRVFALELETR